MGRLDDRYALVTGAGAGIGRAISQRFAAEGAHVLVTDRALDTAEETAGLIAGAGGQATPLQIDVTRPDEIALALAGIDTQFGRLDVLVNNAGVNARGDFRNLDDAAWEMVVNVNLYGAVRLARDALPLLRKARAGNIVNVASIMEGRHARQLSTYSTTKAAIAGLSRSLAVEYAAFGIRVNYLCPGYAETEMTRKMMRFGPIREALLARTPLARFATPEDVANAALFLASDEAAYVTGEGLTVDGGMSIAL